MWKEGVLCFARIKNFRADPLVSSIGALIATPFLFAGLNFLRTNYDVSLVSRSSISIINSNKKNGNFNFKFFDMTKC